MKVGIVVLNYNNWADTLNCLQSFIKYEPEAQIYLVDNNSRLSPPDDILAMVNNEQVIYTRNQSNLGYSGGNNIGIEIANKDGCTYIGVVNNDIVIKDSILKKMCSQLEGNCSIVAPQILNVDGSIEHNNFKEDLTLKFKYYSLLRKFFGQKETLKVELQLGSDKTVRMVSGCFFLFKSSEKYLLKFDENLFLYMEEYLIAEYLRSNGKTAKILGDCQAVHLGGKSTATISGNALFFLMCSEIYYFIHIRKDNKLFYLLILLHRLIQFTRFNIRNHYLLKLKTALRLYLCKETPNWKRIIKILQL